ncbi:MAG: metalloregulator ArsR/SmtB family transcription factor [bacterium]
MDDRTRALFNAQATVLKALAHPTRLFIVDRLRGGEKCVCELTAMIGVDVSTVSKHLSILKNAGIVRDDKRGTQVFYTLEMPCVLNFFSCVQSVIQSKAEGQIKLVRKT